MKILKTLFWILGLCVVLALSAVVVVTTLVDPNEYKPHLEQAVEKNLGRKLTMSGDLSLTFFPWVGIEANQVELSNPLNFDDEPMISVNKVSGKIKLLPLLKKQIEIGEVLLSAPVINLKVLQDGSTNWQDLLRTNKKNTQYYSEEGSAFMGLVIQGVSIEAGQLSWIDQSSDQTLFISDINLRTGVLQPEIPLDIEFDLAASGSLLPSTFKLSLNTTVNTNDTYSLIELLSSELEIQASDAVDDKELELTIEKTSVNFDKDIISVKGLSLKSLGTNLTTSLDVVNFSSLATVQGELILRFDDITEVLEKFDIDLELDDEFIEDFNIKTQFGFLNNIITFNHFSMHSEVAGQTIKLKIPSLNCDLGKGTLKSAEIKLNTDQASMFISVVGEKMLGNWQGMRVQGQMILDVTDMDRLIRAIGLQESVPLGLTDSFSNKLTYEVEQGHLMLNMMETTFDDSSAVGAVRIRNILNEREPMLSVKQNIYNIDVGKLLTALRITDVFKGTGQLSTDLNNINLSSDSDLSELSGFFDVQLKDGFIQGFDLQETLLTIRNLANATADKDELKYQPSAETEFAELSGRFKGENGRFVTDNLVMTAPVFKMNGAGFIDFAEASLNLDLDVVVNSLEEQGDMNLAGFEDVVIPLVISGKLDTPSFKLDFSKLLVRQAKQRLKKELKEKGVKEDTLKADVTKKIKEKLDEKLKSLFGD